LEALVVWAVFGVFAVTTWQCYVKGEVSMRSVVVTREHRPRDFNTCILVLVVGCAVLFILAIKVTDDAISASTMAFHSA
jgi:hypothetical protein